MYYACKDATAASATKAATSENLDIRDSTN